VSAGPFLLAFLSLALAAQSAYASMLMLYAWQDKIRSAHGRAPASLLPPGWSFTVLLPARHEEAVIEDTLQRIADLRYPRELVQIVVIVEAGDEGTAIAVNRKIAELEQAGVDNVSLVRFAEPPINKPHALNVGLAHARGDVVTIFDAEDEPHPDILRVVNTIMQREGAAVVQSGVQLMNYADRWYCALNVLEYFFWFKSRLHYHASIGMVPLGGNTVFIRRPLLEQHGGWDQECLTEDADLGMRLSAAGAAIRVVYDDAYVTREETPPTVPDLVRQRTRWDQGFLQVLMKGDWRRLPTLGQRLLALYTLSFSLLQVLTLAYLPFSVWLMFFARVPVLVAMVSAAPLYALAIQVTLTLVGLREFAYVHRLRSSRLLGLQLVLAYLPYHWLLSFAAVRALWRFLRGANGWEKTTHVGAHRTAQLRPLSPLETGLEADVALHG